MEILEREEQKNFRYEIVGFLRPLERQFQFDFVSFVDRHTFYQRLEFIFATKLLSHTGRQEPVFVLIAILNH